MLTREQLNVCDAIALTHDEYVKLCEKHTFANSAFIMHYIPDGKIYYYTMIKYPCDEYYQIVVCFMAEFKIDVNFRF